MKLFVVACYLLLAVTNGFQPLAATKMVTSPSAIKKVMEPPKKVVTPKKPLPGDIKGPSSPTKKVVPSAPGKKK
jgi:hypothetical protein